jgi:putative flippase GtrA
MSFGRQFIRFALVGLMNTVIQYVFFILGFQVIHVPILVASSIGYLAGVVNSYFCNRFWTFQLQSRPRIDEFVRFAVVNSIALGVNLIVLHTLVVMMGMRPEIAQILAIAFSTLVNFSGNKWWAFQIQPEKINE